MRLINLYSAVAEQAGSKELEKMEGFGSSARNMCLAFLLLTYGMEFPEKSISTAGKPEWGQILQPIQNALIYKVRIHVPEGVNIPGVMQ